MAPYPDVLKAEAPLALSHTHKRSRYSSIDYRAKGSRQTVSGDLCCMLALVCFAAAGYAYLNAPSARSLQDSLRRAISQGLPDAPGLEARASLLQRALSGELQKEDAQLRGDLRAAGEQKKMLQGQLSELEREREALASHDRAVVAELRGARRQEEQLQDELKGAVQVGTRQSRAREEVEQELQRKDKQLDEAEKKVQKEAHEANDLRAQLGREESTDKQLQGDLSALQENFRNVKRSESQLRSQLTNERQWHQATSKKLHKFRKAQLALMQTLQSADVA